MILQPIRALTSSLLELLSIAEHRIVQVPSLVRKQFVVAITCLMMENAHT
jgi:hypothetical protein